MFDKTFRKAPFMRVLIPLAAGIIMARYSAMPAFIIWILGGMFILSLILIMILADRTPMPLFPLTDLRNGMLAGIFQGLFFCMGLMMGREEGPTEIPETMFLARICEEMLAGERTYRTRLDRVYYHSGEEWTRLDGRVQVYFGREERCRDLLPGDCICGFGKLERYTPPVNPFEFNYADYQQGKGVYYHLYLDSASWVPTPAHTSMGWQVRAILIRRTLMDRIDRSIEGEEEKAILYSLLLGYRAELGQEIKQQFVRSGSMHILAVSGLHVGILYLLPAFLIRKIRGCLAGRLLATLLLILLLWSYAMLSGLSPSVVRAVTMCTVHRMAILTGRKTGIFHVLSLTAFLMVLYRPAILFESGFQLSFAAVAGIAGFQKPLSGLIQARGWLARSTWQLVTVSIAAQLATAPLSLYYFHQFSNVFIFSNLVVIPLATVILYVGLAFILLSSISGYLLSGILEWLTTQLDGITRLMGRIPGAFMDDITLVPVQVFLLYLAIILAGIFIRYRKTILIHGFMLAFAMYLLVSGIRDFRARSHEGFYVFSIPRESAISFIRGNDHSIYRGGRIRGDSLQIPYAIRNFCIRHKLSSPVLFPNQSDLRHTCMVTRESSMIYTLFKDRRILIIRQLSGYYEESTVSFETDILVLVDNVSCNLDKLLSVFKPGLIIVDGSSHPWYHEKVARACMRHGIPYHSTEKDGFYVY